MAELSAQAAAPRTKSGRRNRRVFRSRQSKDAVQQATDAGLDLLRVLGWQVLHDVVVPGDPARSRQAAIVDHLLAGPSGVYVVNTVTWAGAIHATEHALTVGKADRAVELAEVSVAADLVRAVLPGIPVAPMLCFERLEKVTGVVSDVALCASENILDLLTSQPTIIDQSAFAKASRMLATVCRPDARKSEQRAEEPEPATHGVTTLPGSSADVEQDSADVPDLSAAPTEAATVTSAEDITRVAAFERLMDPDHVADPVPDALPDQGPGSSETFAAIHDAGAAIWRDLTSTSEVDVDVEAAVFEAELWELEIEEERERATADAAATEARIRKAREAVERVQQEALRLAELEAAELAERAAHQQAEREAAERAEAERAEAERVEAERAEAERVEAERLEAERVEAERLEAERLEAERVEAERLEAERVEAERLEAERVEAELLEAERAEAERVEAERVEAERLEAELLEAERAETERIRAEQEHAERIRAEQEQAMRIRAEQERAEQAEAERIRAEQAEAERIWAEAERIRTEQAEAERIRTERAAAEQVAVQYVEPQYVEPQYVEPQYVEPQYVEPQYVEPEYVDEQELDQEPGQELEDDLQVGDDEVQARADRVAAIREREAQRARERAAQDAADSRPARRRLADPDRPPTLAPRSGPPEATATLARPVSDVRTVRTRPHLSDEGEEEARPTRALLLVALGALLIAAVVIGAPRVPDLVSEVHGIFAKAPGTKVGATVNVKATAGHPDVTLLAGNPVTARATGDFRPPKGQHLVAVPLRLTNDGLVRWDIPLNARVTLTDGSGASRSVAKAVTGLRGLPLLPAQAQVAPGNAVTGYVAFAVPDGQDVRSVRLSLSRAGGDSVTWQVAP